MGSGHIEHRALVADRGRPPSGDLQRASGSLSPVKLGGVSFKSLWYAWKHPKWSRVNGA